MGGCVFVLLLCLVGLSAGQREITVQEKLKEDSDLSQFLALLERNKVTSTTLEFRQVTLFAPTNEAFQRYTGEIDDNLVLYHMTNLATTLQNLDYSINSEYDGNPPLWITRRRDALHDDIYINNARVLASRSYQSINRNKMRQVLHVIDEVLCPVQSLPSTSNPIYNPTAYHFLERSDELAIGPHRLRSFRQKVHQLNKRSDFEADGRHTFFMPVEEGFKPAPRPELVDAKIIDGHIIPNHVLFTTATPNERSYETLAFRDNLKVTVAFSTSHIGTEKIMYVKSNTLMGDSKHSPGVVIAEIVKANIPVKNGVVHLIQRPLMVVDTSVTQFLEGIDKQDGPLFKFYEVMMDLGGEFFERLKHMKDLTLFAPSNEAWKDPSLSHVIRNKQKLLEILYLHLVYDRLSMEKIIQNNQHQIYQVPTAANRKYLYFNVIHYRNNVTLTVEAGGVNATIIQPNIAATNGFVHIIDRVLGVPHTTVYEKLRTDPMLNTTFQLGRKKLFNHQLNDKDTRYTYFVPRDRAWDKFAADHPSAYRKLFMEDYSYLTKQILERHLIRADRAFTMNDMKLYANETNPIILPSLRDTLRLRVKETDKNFHVEWQGRWIHVFRPDVECTNGIIHVIDSPFVLESDVVAVGGASAIQNTIMTASVLMLSWCLAWIVGH